MLMINEKCLKPLMQMQRMRFNIEWILNNWISYYIEEEREKGRVTCEIICINNIVIDVEETSESIKACIKILFEDNTDIVCDEKPKSKP